MTDRKKLIITIVIVTIAILLSVSAVVVVLVASKQFASSDVNVEYVVDDAAVRVSATGFTGANVSGTSYKMYSSGNEYLDLNPTKTTGAINQTETKLSLSVDTPKIIYEYKFHNLVSIHAQIALSMTSVTKTNINVTYDYSDSRIENFSQLSPKDTYQTQLLESGAGKTMYVYIIVEMSDSMTTGVFKGTIKWTISKTTPVSLTLNYSADSDLTSAPSTSVKKYIKGTTISEPEFEQVVGFRFNRWHSSSSLASEQTFPITLNSNKTLYADYQVGTIIPSSNIEYSDGSYWWVGMLSGVSGELIMPDLYNDGTNGVAPVMGIADNYILEGGIKQGFLNSLSVTALYYSNNVVNSGAMVSVNFTYGGYYNGCDTLTLVEFGRSIETINASSFYPTSSIATINFPNSVKKITYIEDSPGYGETSYYSAFYGTTFYNNNNSRLIQTYNDTESYVIVNGTGVKFAANIYMDFDETWDNVICVADESFSVNGGNSTLLWYEQPVKAQYFPSLRGCTSLESVTINNKLCTELPDYAMYGCTALTSFTMGDNSNLKVVGDYAFYGCTSLNSVSLKEGLETIGDGGGHSFAECIGLENVIIPDSVAVLSRRSFYNCLNLESVKLPNGLNFALSQGSECFYKCSKLNNVVIPQGYTQAPNSWFASCSSLTNIIIPRSVTYIANYAFSSCSALTHIDIPNSVKSIGANAFRGSGLIQITLPNGLESIGQSAFQNCTSLVEANIPRKVSTIGQNAFANCNSLTDLYYNATNVTSFDTTAFNDIGINGTGVDLIIGKDVEVIPDSMFSESNAKIISITFEQGSTCNTIGSSAFANLDDITELRLVSGIINVGVEFINNSTITSLYIPSSVVNLGACVPYEINLTSLELEDPSVIYIAFPIIEEDGLEEVSLGGGLTAAENASKYNAYGLGDYESWTKQ